METTDNKTSKVGLIVRNDNKEVLTFESIFERALGEHLRINMVKYRVCHLTSTIEEAQEFLTEFKKDLLNLFDYNHSTGHSTVFAERMSAKADAAAKIEAAKNAKIEAKAKAEEAKIARAKEREDKAKAKAKIAKAKALAIERAKAKKTKKAKPTKKRAKKNVKKNIPVPATEAAEVTA